jgi:hypothetical protein
MPNGTLEKKLRVRNPPEVLNGLQRFVVTI